MGDGRLEDKAGPVPVGAADSRARSDQTQAQRTSEAGGTGNKRVNQPHASGCARLPPRPNKAIYIESKAKKWESARRKQRSVQPDVKMDPKLPRQEVAKLTSSSRPTC